jgi:hypothetical protein
VQWLEEIWVFRHSFTTPDVPATSSILRIMPQTINWQPSDRFDSDAQLLTLFGWERNCTEFFARFILALHDIS